jgi:hypothetical protein
MVVVEANFDTGVILGVGFDIWLYMFSASGIYCEKD